MKKHTIAKRHLLTMATLIVSLFLIIYLINKFGTLVILNAIVAIMVSMLMGCFIIFIPEYLYLFTIDSSFEGQKYPTRMLLTILGISTLMYMLLILLLWMFTDKENLYFFYYVSGFSLVGYLLVVLIMLWNHLLNKEE